jgi:hypothetical protein
MAMQAVAALVAAAMAVSVALLAFGIESVIELRAAAVVLHRFRYEQSGGDGPASDRRALRLVGVSFVALAVYVLIHVVITLVSGAHPETSALGLAVAA